MISEDRADRFTANGGAILIPPPWARCTVADCTEPVAALWADGWRCAGHPAAGAALLEVDAAAPRSEPCLPG